MQVLKRVGVLSCGKITGLLYALIGLIIGGIFALLSLVGAGMAASGGGSEALWGAMFGVGAVILMPLFYGVMGFIGGLITGLLYNLIAGWIGGLEMELVDSGPSTPAY
ncbi:MAG: hypothetical protein V3T72_09645 [Thermoanaerobaculia bacterium]